MRRPKPTTWFAAMRCDGALFAMIGCLVMLLNVLQPVASAYAATDGAICTMLDQGAGGDVSSPSGSPEKCPICLAAWTCPVVSPAYKAALAAAPAFPEPAALPKPVFPRDLAPTWRASGGEPPPAIRAPPSDI